MFTVLMIDDAGDVIEVVRGRAIESMADIDFQGETDFGRAMQSLQRVRPSILILDIYRGSPVAGDDPGEAVWSRVWREWFCPLIIYTAGVVDFDDPALPAHPFIRVVNKGGGSEEQVVRHLLEFAPHADALKSVGAEIDRVTHTVLRDLSHHIFRAEADEGRRANILVRAARRRIAAMMDNALLIANEPLHPWEQYIFPVLTDHLLTGDVLRVRDMPPQDPTSFRVVLTPTCDMVPAAAGRRIANVVVAKCDKPELFVTRGMNLPNANARTVRDRLETALNEHHQRGIVLLPECPGCVPLMALNLRNLEVIPVESIGTQNDSDRSLIRVASLDSPFREFLAWAHLQVSCRVGIPARDNAELIEELVARCNPAKEDRK